MYFGGKRLKHNIVNQIVFLGAKLFQQLNTTDDDFIHRAEDDPWTTEVTKFYIIQVTKPVKALGPEKTQCNSGTTRAASSQHQHRQQQPVSTTCTASSQHQRQHRHPAPATCLESARGQLIVV